MQKTALDHESSRLVARIDLDRLAENWRNLNKLSGTATAAAVIKANGYGHGVRPVALALEHAGCGWFFTATMEEAVTVREICPQARIACFDGLTKADAGVAREFGIMPSINDPAELEVLHMLASAAGAPVPALIQVDTGMNRLGSGVDTMAELAASPLLAAGDWQLVYSHLASADEPENEQNMQQKDKFDAARNLFPGIPASLAATGGIMLGDGFHYELTRPGIGLYGLPLVVALRGHVKPVLSLHARILQIRNAETGEDIGYNATARLTRPSRLATIAGGYADGVRRQLSNKGCAHKSGLTAAIIGRVSMDTTIIDITDWPEDHAAVGDYVDLLHDGYTADEMAQASGTVGYDVLTTLGLRAKQHYAGGILKSISL